MSPFIDFLVDSLGFGATFMYGSTGEIITEKAGHLNLGISTARSIHAFRRVSHEMMPCVRSLAVLRS